MDDLGRMFEMQSEYQKKLRAITDENRSDEMRKLCLALHSEVTDLSRCINIRPHGEDTSVNRDRILYDAVDVLRYTIAILNNWGFDSFDLTKAYGEKDAYLRASHEYDQNVYDGRPVVICDMDDILTEFRVGYYKWVNRTYGIKTDPNTTQYYMVDEFKEIGVNPEDAFRRFISSGGMYDLDAVPGSAMMIYKLVEAGFWVHILTARPEEDPACKYGTYMWLNEIGVPCHKLSFAPEKYRWLVQSGYGDRVVCAIDDSSKHVAEYLKHGVAVVCPRKSYNTDLGSHPKLHWYDDACDVPSIVTSLAKLGDI
jgi:hypothetical protein